MAFARLRLSTNGVRFISTPNRSSVVPAPDRSLVDSMRAEFATQLQAMSRSIEQRIGALAGTTTPDASGDGLTSQTRASEPSHLLDAPQASPGAAFHSVLHPVTPNVTGTGRSALHPTPVASFGGLDPHAGPLPRARPPAPAAQSQYQKHGGSHGLGAASAAPRGAPAYTSKLGALDDGFGSAHRDFARKLMVSLEPDLGRDPAAADAWLQQAANRNVSITVGQVAIEEGHHHHHHHHPMPGAAQAPPAAAAHHRPVSEAMPSAVAAVEDVRASGGSRSHAPNDDAPQVSPRPAAVSDGSSSSGPPRLRSAAAEVAVEGAFRASHDFWSGPDNPQRSPRRSGAPVSSTAPPPTHMLSDRQLEESLGLAVLSEHQHTHVHTHTHSHRVLGPAEMVKALRRAVSTGAITRGLPTLPRTHSAQEFVASNEAGPHGQHPEHYHHHRHRVHHVHGQPADTNPHTVRFDLPADTASQGSPSVGSGSSGTQVFQVGAGDDGVLVVAPRGSQRKDGSFLVRVPEAPYEVVQIQNLQQDARILSQPMVPVSLGQLSASGSSSRYATATSATVNPVLYPVESLLPNWRRR